MARPGQASTRRYTKTRGEGQDELARRLAERLADGQTRLANSGARLDIEEVEAVSIDDKLDVGAILDW